MAASCRIADTPIESFAYVAIGCRLRLRRPKPGVDLGEQIGARRDHQALCKEAAHLCSDQGSTHERFVAFAKKTRAITSKTVT
jgi:hypothetical protein